MLPLQIDAEDAIARGIEFAGVDGILRHGEIGRCVHHAGETLSLVLVDRYVLAVEFELSNGFLRCGEDGFLCVLAARAVQTA